MAELMTAVVAVLMGMATIWLEWMGLREIILRSKKTKIHLATAALALLTSVMWAVSIGLRPNIISVLSLVSFFALVLFFGIGVAYSVFYRKMTRAE